MLLVRQTQHKRKSIFMRAYKTLKVLTVTIAVALAIICPLQAFASTGKHVSKTRKATGQVIDYSPKDSIVYIETSDGNVWMISEADFEIGDIVSVKFDTRNTKRKQDDKILRVYYKGYCDFMVF